MPHTDSLTIYAEVIPPYYLLVVWVWIYWLLLMIWKAGSQWCSPLPVTLFESSYFYYAMLPREEDTRAAYLFRESPVLCQFWGSEMGAGSCTGDGLVRLLSQKAPVDFDWRTSGWEWCWTLNWFFEAMVWSLTPHLCIKGTNFALDYLTVLFSSCCQ